MAELDVKSFEQRAATAEQRLAAIESKLAAGAGSLNVDVYVSQLVSLREIMVAAKTEQEQLEQRVAELEADNLKLQYQVKHLKRALVEADEKLATN